MARVELRQFLMRGVLIQLFILLRVQMQKERDLNMMIKGLLISRGFSQMDNQQIEHVFKLLEIGTELDTARMDLQVIEALKRLTNQERESKPNYFDQPRHETVPLFIKMFVSDIVRNVIKIRGCCSDSDMPEEPTRALPNFPYFPYPMFPMSLLTQLNNNPISQQILNSSSNQYQQMPDNLLTHFMPNISQSIQPNNASFESFPTALKKQLNFFGLRESEEHGLNHREQRSQNSSLSSFRYSHEDMIRENIRMVPEIKVEENNRDALPGFLLNVKKQMKKRSKKVKKEKKMMETIQIQTDFRCFELGFKKAPKTRQIKKHIRFEQSFSEDSKRIEEGQNKMKIKQERDDLNQGLVINTENKPIPEKEESKDGSSIIEGKFLPPLNKFTGQGRIVIEEKMENEKADSGSHEKHPMFEVEEVNEEINPYQHFDRVSQSEEIESIQDSHHYELIKSVQNEVPVQSLVSIMEKCPCNGSIESSNIFKCPTCHGVFHCQCLQADSNKIECPICQLRTVDCFEPVQQVVKQCYFSNINNSKFTTTINIAPYQQVKNSGKDRNCDLQIRCFRIEPSYERTEISWPDEVVITVNGKKIAQTYGLLKNSLLKKRKDNSYVITSQAFADDIRTEVQDYQNIKIQIEAEVTPQIAARRKIDNNFTYLFGVYVVRRIKPEELCQKIVGELREVEEDYINGLYDINVPQEAEVGVEMMSCRLQDPYTRKLMNLPVRGAKCLHAQCFDLKSHLGFIWISRIRVWKCPVCSKEARQFKVDRQQLELIQRAKLNRVVPEEVIFYKGEIFFKVFKAQGEQTEMKIEERQNSKEDRQDSQDKSIQAKEYIFYHYHPLLEMTQVSFTPQLVFNKPKRPEKKVITYPTSDYQSIPPKQKKPRKNAKVKIEAS